MQYIGYFPMYALYWRILLSILSIFLCFNIFFLIFPVFLRFFICMQYIVYFLMYAAYWIFINVCSISDIFQCMPYIGGSYFPHFHFFSHFPYFWYFPGSLESRARWRLSHTHRGWSGPGWPYRAHIILYI